jgi:hypothetical protein
MVPLAITPRSLSDDTGLTAKKNVVYVVVDVQVESLPGDDEQFVWLRVRTD